MPAKSKIISVIVSTFVAIIICTLFTPMLFVVIDSAGYFFLGHTLLIDWNTARSFIAVGFTAAGIIFMNLVYC